MSLLESTKLRQKASCTDLGCVPFRSGGGGVANEQVRPRANLFDAPASVADGRAPPHSGSPLPHRGWRPRPSRHQLRRSPNSVCLGALCRNNMNRGRWCSLYRHKAQSGRAGIMIAMCASSMALDSSMEDGSCPRRVHSRRCWRVCCGWCRSQSRRTSQHQPEWRFP